MYANIMRNLVTIGPLLTVSAERINGPFIVSVVKSTAIAVYPSIYLISRAHFSRLLPNLVHPSTTLTGHVHEPVLFTLIECTIPYYIVPNA